MQIPPTLKKPWFLIGLFACLALIVGLIFFPKSKEPFGANNRSGWEPYAHGEFQADDGYYLWRSIFCPGPATRGAAEKAAMEAHEELRLEVENNRLGKVRPKQYFLRVEVYEELGEVKSDILPYLKISSSREGASNAAAVQWRTWRSPLTRPTDFERAVVYDFLFLANRSKNTPFAKLSRADKIVVLTLFSVENKIEVDEVLSILERYYQWDLGEDHRNSY